MKRKITWARIKIVCEQMRSREREREQEIKSQSNIQPSQPIPSNPNQSNQPAKSKPNNTDFSICTHFISPFFVSTAVCAIHFKYLTFRWCVRAFSHFSAVSLMVVFLLLIHLYTRVSLFYARVFQFFNKLHTDTASHTHTHTCTLRHHQTTTTTHPSNDNFSYASVLHI